MSDHDRLVISIAIMCVAINFVGAAFAIRRLSPLFRNRQFWVRPVEGGGALGTKESPTTRYKATAALGAVTIVVLFLLNLLQTTILLFFR